MEPFAKLTPMARRSVLAVIMLVILLALTATAWIVSRSISPLRTGETWYLARVGDQPVGWQVVQRQVAPGEGSRGYSITFLRPKGFSRGEGGPWEVWRLREDQRNGSHLSGVAGDQAGGLIVSAQMAIDYDAPQLTITLRTAGVRRTLEVGGDYIAEGGLRPTVVNVAQGGPTVQGRLAVDGRLTLVSVIIEAEGPIQYTLDGHPTNLTAVRLTLPSQDADIPARRYLVGDDGSIVVLEILDGQGRITQTFTRASLDAIRRYYPRAHLFRNQLLKTLQQH